MGSMISQSTVNGVCHSNHQSITSQSSVNEREPCDLLECAYICLSHCIAHTHINKHQGIVNHPFLSPNPSHILECRRRFSSMCANPASLSLNCWEFTIVRGAWLLLTSLVIQQSRLPRPGLEVRLQQCAMLIVRVTTMGDDKKVAAISKVLEHAHGLHACQKFPIRRH